MLLLKFDTRYSPAWIRPPPGNPAGTTARSEGLTSPLAGTVVVREVGTAGRFGTIAVGAPLAAETSAGTARCLTCGSAALRQGSLFKCVVGTTHLRPMRARTILKHYPSPGLWSMEVRARAHTDPIRLRLAENCLLVSLPTTIAKMGQATAQIKKHRASRSSVLERDVPVCGGNSGEESISRRYQDGKPPVLLRISPHAGFSSAIHPPALPARSNPGRPCSARGRTLAGCRREVRPGSRQYRP